MQNMTLLIDPETHDLVLDEEGIIKTITGDDTVTQAARLTLEVWKEEWPLDISHGVDYERILGKKPHELEEDEIAEVIREAIFQEGEIVEIESLNIQRDSEKRELYIEFVAVLSNGNKISSEVTTR